MFQPKGGYLHVRSIKRQIGIMSRFSFLWVHSEQRCYWSLHIHCDRHTQYFNTDVIIVDFNTDDTCG